LINIVLDIINYILVAILIGVSATWIALIKSMLKTFHESPFLDKFEKKEHGKPKVSIILPARNEEKFIGKCLDSLIKQDYDNYEIITINDSSKDSTGDIIKKYSEKFDILAIEIIGNSNGVYDLSVGHPSSTASISKSFGITATKDIGKHKTMIISTGKESSNNTLGKSLSSLWNCSDAVKNDGFAILIAECKLGIGSDGIQSFIDGRMNMDSLKKPSQYIDGMENLLYITEIQKKFQLGLLSILPTHYTKKLNMIPFDGVKQVMDYVLKNQGQNQKVEVISDGARTLLR